MNSNGQTMTLPLPGLANCTSCVLSAGRHRVVAGFGIYPNRVMLIGQSPGEEEDYRGVPFVGKSGDLLRKICSEVGWDLDQLFRTNVNRCRPPGNRKALPAERKACAHYLDEEFDIVDPDVVVLLGADAYKAVLSKDAMLSPITQVRGAVFKRSYRGRERYFIPTVHPSFVLQSEYAHYSELRDDLATAKAIIDGTLDASADVKPFRRTEATWAEVLAAAKAPLFGFDLETDSEEREAEIVGIGICAEEGNGCYIAFPNDEIDVYDAIVQLRPYLESAAHVKVVSNIDFERHVLHHYGVRVRGYWDTLLESWILGDRPLGLKDGYQRAFGVEMIHIKKFQDMGYVRRSRNGKLGPDMKAATLEAREAVVEYAAQDPDASLRLHKFHMQIFDQRPSLYELYTNIELPFAEEIFHMEDAGITFDSKSPYLVEGLKQLKAHLANVLEWAGDLAQEDFNPGSWQQVQKLLYDQSNKHAYVIPRERWPRFDKTKSQYPGTDKTVLAEFADNLLVRAILTCRAVAKMIGTYVEPLPKWVSDDGRIHCRIRQTGTDTGRVSTSDPNLGNIPSRQRDDVDLGEFRGKTIRKAFIAPAGHVIGAPDISQIEMRVIAHLSGDPEMIRQLTDPAGDIHSKTAEIIYGKTAADVDPNVWENWRYLATTINFGTAYGLTADGLIMRTPTLGLTLKDASRFINSFYDGYPRFKTWQLDTVQFCIEHGYVESMMGRRRYFPDIRATNHRLRSEAARGAMNMPVQGSAADYFKMCVLAVSRKLKELELRTRMIMQVYDEIVLEIPDDEVDVIGTQVAPLMADVYPLKVPVRIDFEVGPSWGDLKKWKTS